jgi:hypothetical protein
VETVHDSFDIAPATPAYGFEKKCSLDAALIFLNSTTLVLKLLLPLLLLVNLSFHSKELISE